ncbi:MAG: hypothetical protein ABFQ65_02890 [Nanoarchaeota archaeon]
MTKECKACFNEVEQTFFYFGMEFCEDCYKIVKSKIYKLTSKQMIRLSTFLSYWSGLKFLQEEKDKRKAEREQKKKLLKLGAQK